MRPKVKPGIGQLFVASDAIQLFLNTYSLCYANWERLYNLLQKEHLESSYGFQAADLRNRIRSGAPITELKHHIASGENDDALVSAIALLSTLAECIADQEGSKLSRFSKPFQDSAGCFYWLARKGDSWFPQVIPLLTRTTDELHRTLRRYHEPILVTPAELNEWKLSRIGIDEALENLFEQRMRSQGFRIAVSPLSSKAKMLAETQPREYSQPPSSFHLTSIEPLSEQLTALRAVLEQATAKGASILVLPELRMPPELLEATKDFLRQQDLSEGKGLLLVAAGSWHVAGGGGHYNRCVVLNHYGREMWTHDKLREYVVTPENFRAAPDFFSSLGIDERGASEGIHRGRDLSFYDSVAGRLAVAICVGFFSPEVEPLLQASGANIFLVPAMTPSITALQARAEALVHTQNAATFVANCGAAATNKAFSFFKLPTKLPQSRAQLTEANDLLLFDFNDLSNTSRLHL